MAVPEQTPYIEHTGNGATTSFALKFQCESKDHLIVLVDEIEPPIATWSLIGGNVVFTTAPAAGKKITLQRNTPFSRNTDYQSYNNSFRPPAVNKDFDWIWWKLQELGVADWILGARIDALKNYVDRKDDELKAYLMEEIRKQGVALDQLDEYYNYLMERLAQIAVDKGWDASLVVDKSGLSQQAINDLNLLSNPVGFFDINGVGDETAKLQALLDTLPKIITLDPAKIYNTTGKLFVKSDCVIDGRGAEINCTAPISTLEMTGSSITALTKDEFTITVADATKFSIFDDILVYYNEDNSDTWYTENQLNFDVLGITSQKNQILGISGNVLTLKFKNESKLSDLPARTSAVYKVPQNEVIIKNTTFNITANSWVWLRCSGIRYQNCKFKKLGGTLSAFSVQMGYAVNFIDSEIGENLGLGFNYGSYNCYAEKNTFYAGRESDGLLLTYAGSNFITSRDNRFLVRNATAKSGNAGLYWGAKSRNCHSYNDVVVGLDYGFRIMFGAQQCSINNMTTKNIVTFTGFISYSSVEINNLTGFDKPIRSINAENLTIKGGFLFSTDKSANPLLLDLHRNASSDIRKNYRIEGLICEGRASVTVGVEDFVLLNNRFKQFDNYASAVSKGWDIRGNVAGAMRFSLARDFKISGNTIDGSLAPGVAAYGLQFRLSSHVSEFEGNTIKHSTVGVNREQESAQIYLAKGANNNIIAPVQLDIGQTALPLPVSEFNSLCGLGFTILSSDYYATNKSWIRSLSGWRLAPGATASETYNPPVLSAAGTAGDSVTTTVTLIGVAVGQAAQASFDKYNAGVRIYSVVSAANTVTVEFRNTSAEPVDLASGVLTVQLI